MGDQLTGVELIQELRHALRYLYVTAELRKSRLLPLLGLEGQGATASLRALLTEAIAALKPGAETPPQARPWRIYNALLYQYVQQLSQEEVAAALGVSARQLRRQDSQALQLLAEHLVAQHGLADRLQREGDTLWPVPAGDEEAAEMPVAAYAAPSRDQELAWVEQSEPNQVTDLLGLLERTQQTIAPLAEKLAVKIITEPGTVPLLVTVPPAMVQQALVMVYTAALRAADGGRVVVRAAAESATACVSFAVSGPAGMPVDLAAAAVAPDIAESLRMGQQLLSLAGGRLATHLPAEPGTAMPEPALCVLVPAIEELAVLVVDDNTDSLRLFQRYLAGTRYTFVGARDADQALHLAAAVKPSMIVLDVMLPEVDGWQTLAQLRQRADLRDVPVIICTILPEEQLALTLGADGYLRKPVSRTAFLTALDAQVRRQGQAVG